jgi:hypothetical protein
MFFFSTDINGKIRFHQTHESFEDVKKACEEEFKKEQSKETWPQDSYNLCYGVIKGMVLKNFDGSYELKTVGDETIETIFNDIAYSLERLQHLGTGATLVGLKHIATVLESEIDIILKNAKELAKRR